MNFEFSLENGKHQLKTGLFFLIAAVVVATITAILVATVRDDTARIVLGIIFALAAAALWIVTAIKLIFGIVVYHAERTASRNNPA